MQPAHYGAITDFMLEFLPEIAMKFYCRLMELFGQFRLFHELAVMGALLRGDLGRPPGARPFNQAIDAWGLYLPGAWGLYFALRFQSWYHVRIKTGSIRGTGDVLRIMQAHREHQGGAANLAARAPGVKPPDFWPPQPPPL